MRDRVLDLNADLGEEVTDDAGLLRIVTSANVACGYHAGSAEIMRAACAQAAERGVSVGAQVSYADRENFGRVRVDVEPGVLREQVADQVGTLTAIAQAETSGRRVLLEGFPDRGYGPGGRLLPRTEPGALLDDSAAIAAQALQLAPSVDSLCVHGDSPGAVAHVGAVRRALESAGWSLRGL